jgi:hypothetical protein
VSETEAEVLAGLAEDDAGDLLNPRAPLKKRPHLPMCGCVRNDAVTPRAGLTFDRAIGRSGDRAIGRSGDR